MKIVNIGIIIAIVLCLASCGSGASQLELQPETERTVSASAADWVAAWNANNDAFHFAEISEWNDDVTFSSLHTSGLFAIDKIGFTTAMAVAMVKPALLTPTNSSVLGLWYDSLGDDLE
jgi:hypothetical protein